MQRWFSFGTSSSFLIKTWMTDTVTGLSTAIVCSIILVIIVTTTKYYVQILAYKSSDPHYRLNRGSNTWIWLHIYTSAIYIVQVASSYLMMLCAMTYDGRVFLSIVSAAGFCYYFLEPIAYRQISKMKYGVLKSPENDNLSLKLTNYKQDNCKIISNNHT